MCTAFSDALASPLVQEWLQGHRLGVAATLCLDGNPALATNGVLNHAEDLIAEYLKAVRYGDRDSSLLKLPLFALRQMHRLSQMKGANQPMPEISERAECLGSVIRRLTVWLTEAPEAVCLARVEELVESLVYHSNWGAEQLRRLLISQADKRFIRHADLWRGRDDDFTSFLSILRAPWIDGPTTLTRLDAAARFCNLLLAENTYIGWLAQRVASGLMDQLFAWPLLILGQRTGVSLPLGVELVVSEAGTSVRPVRDESPRVVDPSGWKGSYWKILTSVRTLYRCSKAVHSRTRIDGLSVDLDFRFADELIRPLLGCIPLQGRSMEAYLVSAILSRALGQAVSPSTLITWQIGEGMPTDAELEWPEGVLHKLDYAFASAVADRILVPAGRNEEIGDFLDVARDQQTASINQVDSLKKAVRVAIGPIANPHRAIRCPEILLADVRWAGSTMLTEAMVKAINPLLDAGDSLYMDIANHPATLDVTASEIHGALAKREAARGRSLSWLFMRIYEDEDDNALWEMLCEALGASEHQIDHFVRAGSPGRLAKRLAGLLVNRDPGKSPDFVIIVGGSERRRAYEEAPDNSLWRHGLMPVLHELERIAWTATRPEQDPIACRFILAPAKLREISTSDHGAAAEEPEWLDRLRVFRGAFDRGCAALVLEGYKWKGSRLRHELGSAVTKGWLRKLPDGDYLVTSGRGFPVKIIEPQALANVHHAAARAMAPSLASNLKRVGLPLDEARMTASVLEACYHLQQAIRFHGNQEREAQYLFIRRFLRRRSLSSLRAPILVKSIPATVMAWIDEDETRLQAEGIPLHPLVYAWDHEYALAAFKRNSETTWESLQQTLERLFRLFERALRNCDVSEFSASRNYLFLSVVSRLDTFGNRLQDSTTLEDVVKPLAPHRNQDKQRKLLAQKLKEVVQRRLAALKIEDLNREAKQLLLDDVEFRLASAPVGEWCERVASDIRDPVIATQILGRSVVGSPQWVTAWSWFFGALQQTKDLRRLDGCSSKQSPAA